MIAAERVGQSQLFLRALDQLEATPLPGTEGGHTPFFSPDAEWVGFFAKDGTLQKVSVAGGAPVVICDPEAGNNPGASWGLDDTIIFSPRIWDEGLWRVSAAGGTPTRVGPGRWPQILPGGKHVLVTARSEDESLQPVVMSLETGESRPLGRGRAGARYVPSGHLVYGQAGSLMAVGFDLGRLELRGSPRPVLDDVYMHPYDLAYFSFADTGTLAYIPGRNETTLEWVGRDGRGTPLTTAPGDLLSPRVAPDGRRVAVTRLTERADDFEVWVYDAVRGTGNRLGFGIVPAWTPDSARVAFWRDGTEPGIFWQPADGSGPAEPLRPKIPEGTFALVSYSPDGRSLLGSNLNGDIWVLPTEGDPIPVVATPFIDRHATLSPDGR